ncbi:MAG: DUF3783 domain-containing protein [Lachnospiraceae bacterium]|nr:DUF3783 domain-containing protein [Lachnospiraceae bacterium]
MRECILLFAFEASKQKKLMTQLFMAKFRVKSVGTEEMHLPIGYLAGNKELMTQEVIPPEAEHTKTLDSPMLVMAGVTPGRLDMVLGAIRKAGIGAIPYKAVVTEANQTWKAEELLEELKKEHEAMTAEKGKGKMIHQTQ